MLIVQKFAMLISRSTFPYAWNIFTMCLSEYIANCAGPLIKSKGVAGKPVAICLKVLRMVDQILLILKK